jgi:hypothetical protein
MTPDKLNRLFARCEIRKERRRRRELGFRVDRAIARIERLCELIGDGEIKRWEAVATLERLAEFLAKE